MSNNLSIQVNPEKCTGCNACVRVCPVKEANYVTYQPNGQLAVSIHEDRCIKCGECARSCVHGARYFADNKDNLSALRRCYQLYSKISPQAVEISLTCSQPYDVFSHVSA